MADAPRHPLAPLGPDDITSAAAVLRREKALHDRVRFALMVPEEPAKEVVAAHRPGDAVERRVRVQVVDPEARAAWDAVVDITAGIVDRWERIQVGQPPFTTEELFLAIQAVREDPRWQAAVRARGIEDLSTVQIDPWSAGSFGEVPDDRRLARCVCYHRARPADNGYARPLEGIVALVDLHTGQVVEVADHGAVPVPPEAGAYRPDDVGPPRSGLRPLEVVQPEGPSFSVEGNEIRWLGWRVRFSLNQTEGLVLHTVGYEDGGRVRPVLHRASLAEMVVPYGDTAAGHWWKNAFDASEYGVGRLANSLELGCDCLGEITYFDAWFTSERGEPVRVANAVCLHEEDFGILWKHTDLWTGEPQVRRSRRLVLSSISTVGNYDYGFYWYFYLDGTIALEVKSTGIMQTAAIAPGEEPGHGTLVAPGLYAPNHQHLFCFRLDLDVDGTTNTVYEVDAAGDPPGPSNPYGNAFGVREVRLGTELGARRRADAAKSRSWWVRNEGVRNRLGQPVAYRLVPGPTTTLLADDASSIARRAAFAAHNLWVTPYRRDELHAAGDHPNQHPGGAGLAEWTAADRPVDDTDVVLWYTLGITHIARPEEWPVMPVEVAGFSLRPHGFFDRNPALDLPPPDRCHAPAPG